MQCPHCHSETVVKNGTRRLQDEPVVQYYRCRDCHRNFNERTGTPMARLRTPSRVVEFALKNRSEGMGARATGRVFDKSHTTILQWEARLAEHADAWSPPAPEGREVTLEGDEVYTRVGENLPPADSEGWTLTFFERESRYWVTALAGQKDEELFKQGTETTWNWAQGADFIRWFTDGERRYGQALWPLASEYLPERGLAISYPYRKVWREGLEVAMKIKGSQGKPRVEWVKVDHPLTAISPSSEVHANHNEAHNAALRRRCSAYRRRQNLYAKAKTALQRTLDVQRLIHNWVRPHWSLGGKVTPAVAMGFISRPVTMRKLLNSRGFEAIHL